MDKLNTVKLFLIHVTIHQFGVLQERIMKEHSISQRLIIGFGLILTMIIGVVIIAQLNVSGIKKNLTTVNEINSVKMSF